jgi:hypothetical protein
VAQKEMIGAQGRRRERRPAWRATLPLAFAALHHGGVALADRAAWVRAADALALGATGAVGGAQVQAYTAAGAMLLGVLYLLSSDRGRAMRASRVGLALQSVYAVFAALFATAHLVVLQAARDGGDALGRLSEAAVRMHGLGAWSFFAAVVAHALNPASPVHAVFVRVLSGMARAAWQLVGRFAAVSWPEFARWLPGGLTPGAAVAMGFVQLLEGYARDAARLPLASVPTLLPWREVTPLAVDVALYLQGLSCEEATRWAEERLLRRGSSAEAALRLLRVPSACRAAEAAGQTARDWVRAIERAVEGHPDYPRPTFTNPAARRTMFELDAATNAYLLPAAAHAGWLLALGDALLRCWEAWREGDEGAAQVLRGDGPQLALAGAFFGAPVPAAGADALLQEHGRQLASLLRPGRPQASAAPASSSSPPPELARAPAAEPGEAAPPSPSGLAARKRAHPAEEPSDPSKRARRSPVPSRASSRPPSPGPPRQPDPPSPRQPPSPQSPAADPNANPPSPGAPARLPPGHWRAWDDEEQRRSPRSVGESPPLPRDIMPEALWQLARFFDAHPPDAGVAVPVGRGRRLRLTSFRGAPLLSLQWLDEARSQLHVQGALASQSVTLVGEGEPSANPPVPPSVSLNQVFRANVSNGQRRRGEWVLQWEPLR